MDNIFVEFLPPWIETSRQPAFYDKESGTCLQQTARMYDRVNMLVRMFNKLSKQTKETVDHYVEEFTNLYDYVHDYFDNLDVQEEVNHKIDELVEQGVIEGYINRPATDDTLGGIIVSDNLSIDTDGKLSVSLPGLKKNGFVDGGKHTPQYLFTRYCSSGSSTAFDGTKPREMEGIVSTGENKIVVFYRPGTVNGASNVLVEEIDFSDNTDPQILRTATVSGIGSANNACYNPNTGKIYSFVSDSTFAVMDYATFAYGGTITVPDITLASCIAYDNEEDKFYITEGINVWELNITTLDTTLIFSLPDDTLKKSLQGFEVRDGKFYFGLNSPCSIVVANSDGSIDRIMNIDDFDSAGHLASYFGDITFADDNNIIVTPHIDGDFVELTRSKSSYYVNYVAKLNINGNNFEDSNIAGINQSKDLYVDTSLITDGVLYATGSSTYKLPLISEYINNKYKKLYGCRCVPTGTATYYGTLILLNDNLNVAGDLEMEGGSIRGASVTANTISTKSAQLLAHTSTIQAPTLKLGFNDISNQNSFTSCTLIVGSITDLADVEANAIYNLNNNSLVRGYNCFTLFSTDNIAGESGVTVGNISSFKKIKVIVTDSTSQQFCEEAIVPASGDIYLNFNRITFASTTFGRFTTHRLTIARNTGVITIDRDYDVVLKTDPAIEITSIPDSLKLLRVEGYK